VERIEGRNPVREAIRAGRTISRILVATGAQERGALAEIIETARNAKIRVDRVPRARLDHIAESGAHQGIIAEVEDYKYRPWRDGLELAKAREETPLFLALDGITDPHNLGSLLRSAEAFGVHAVLLPERRSSPITAVVAKASAGALEYLVIDRVGNLERALASCKGAGLWLVGLVGTADTSVDECALFEEPVVLIIGDEGRGISRLIRERADQLVRIPQAGRVASLNASVAGAIAMREASGRRRRDFAEPEAGRDRSS
jgi:23S rRNA (guanosine2251-2'-O)-methyltransferase